VWTKDVEFWKVVWHRADARISCCRETHENGFPMVLHSMASTGGTSIIDLIGNMRTFQTANQLGMSSKTLFQWSKQGRVPHITVGFALRFDPKRDRRLAESTEECSLNVLRLFRGWDGNTGI
jgi:hypothetical protein